MSDISIFLNGIIYLEMALIILSIAGQELITKRNKNGFFFWIAANFCGMALFYLDGRGLMVLLYAYYFLKCVQGALKWRELDAKENAANDEIIRLKIRISELEQPSDFSSNDAIESRNVLKKMVSDLAYKQLLSSTKNSDADSNIAVLRGFPLDDGHSSSLPVIPSGGARC